MKAAEQGDAKAQYNIGNMYLQGQGVPRNYKEALRWFMKAAEQGFADAQFNTGALLVGGQEGVLRDLRTALKWMRLAAAQGHPNGKMAVLDIEGQLKSAVEFPRCPPPPPLSFAILLALAWSSTARWIAASWSRLRFFCFLAASLSAMAVAYFA